MGRLCQNWQAQLSYFRLKTSALITRHSPSLSNLAPDLVVDDGNDFAGLWVSEKRSIAVNAPIYIQVLHMNSLAVLTISLLLPTYRPSGHLKPPELPTRLPHP